MMASLAPVSPQWIIPAAWALLIGMSKPNDDPGSPAFRPSDAYWINKQPAGT